MTCSNCDKQMTAKECNYNFGKNTCKNCEEEYTKEEERIKKEQKFLDNNPLEDILF